ncbi:MAG: MFS transporter [Lentisphaerae bacterium]|nr:MFS transporter [Lentisphaerota bacterium]
MLTKILAYFVPFAINFLNGGFFFITSHRFAEADCPATVVASAVAAWGVAYCLVTGLIGKLVKTSNALGLILAGGVMLSLTSAGFLIFDGLYTQFVWLLMSGCGAALFCAPFQLFAKSIENGKSKKSGTVSATSFYTLTWSLGFASGPLAFARVTVKTGFIITLALALAVTGSVVLIALLRKNQAQTNSGSTEEPTGDTRVSVKMPFPEKTFTRLAILGWIVGGLGTLTVSQIRSIWPKQGANLQISGDHVAYVLAVVSYVQAFTALALCRSKCWMWKRVPALLMSVTGILSLLTFAFASDVKIFYTAAACYGVYSGCLYFYLVYHSLAHPSRSGFFVAGNEIIVGVTSMLAPLVGGFIADVTGFTGSAFIFAAAAVVIAFTAQMIMLKPEKLEEEK